MVCFINTFNIYHILCQYAEENDEVAVALIFNFYICGRANTIPYRNEKNRTRDSST